MQAAKSDQGVATDFRVVSRRGSRQKRPFRALCVQIRQEFEQGDGFGRTGSRLGAVEKPQESPAHVLLFRAGRGFGVCRQCGDQRLRAFETRARQESEENLPGHPPGDRRDRADHRRDVAIAGPLRQRSEVRQCRLATVGEQAHGLLSQRPAADQEPSHRRKTRTRIDLRQSFDEIRLQGTRRAFDAREQLSENLRGRGGAGAEDHRGGGGQFGVLGAQEGQQRVEVDTTRGKI